MVAEIRQEFPKFRVVSFQDSTLHRGLWKLGWRMGAMTLWNTVYMKPENIGTDRGAEVLRHEVVHLRDQHRWHVLFFLSYVLLLPVGFSFKAFWEWRAYRETLRSDWEEYRNYPPEYRDYVMAWCAEWVAQQFWSVGYLWMFPVPKLVRRWCAREIERLKSAST